MSVRIRTVIKEIFKYITISMVVVSSFFFGIFYERSKIIEESAISNIQRKDVNIAIDQSDQLIILDKSTGNYIIYQDSIGNSIFKLYAKKMWDKK